MPTKKIVLVIVEGQTEKETLEIFFSRFFDKSMVYVDVVCGDITAQKSRSKAGIMGEIEKIVKIYAKNNHFEPEHFQQVIHVVDTDGAFIPDSMVKPSQGKHHIEYSEKEIHAAEPDDIVERNHKKAGNMRAMSQPSLKVCEIIPYRAYYMSANLDHVLYDKPNNSDKNKTRDARRFSEGYHGDLNKFLAFISESDFSVCGDFKESWDFIMQGTHSLERHTNLGICFEK